MYNTMDGGSFNPHLLFQMHVLHCHSLDSISTNWSSGWRDKNSYHHKTQNQTTDIATKL